MGNTWAICCKEVRLYFTTWTSYILLAAFGLITAFFFQRLLLEYQFRALQYTQMQVPEAMEQMNLTDWVVGPLLMNITVFFLFMLPIVTMRLISEERRHKTFDWLVTLPVRPWEIVLGKYAAGLCMMSAMLVLTLLFPLLLTLYGGSQATDVGALDWRSVLCGYAGLFLLGSAFVSIGLFASSMSSSQMVAVISSFAILMLFYIIGLAARGESGFWQNFFQYLSINTHLESFIRGVIRSQDVVYYLSLAFVGLFLTYRVVEAQRWS